MALILPPNGKGTEYDPKSEAEIVNFVPFSQHAKVPPVRSTTKLYQVVAAIPGRFQTTDGPPAA